MTNTEVASFRRSSHAMVDRLLFSYLDSLSVHFFLGSFCLVLCLSFRDLLDFHVVRGVIQFFHVYEIGMPWARSCMTGLAHGAFSSLKLLRPDLHALVDWNSFNTEAWIPRGYSLDASLPVKTSNRVISLNTTDFSWSEFCNEVTNMHETTTDTNEYLIAFLNLNMDFLWSKLVNSLRLSQEHYLHLLFLRIRVYEFGKCLINLIRILWHVSVQHILNLLLQIMHFNWKIWLLLLEIILLHFKLVQDFSIFWLWPIVLFFEVINLCHQLLILVFNFELLSF